MRNLASCVALCTALAMPLVVTPAVSAQQTSAAPSSAAAAASTSAAAPASAEPSAAATSAAKATEEQGSNGSSLSSDSGLQPNTNATPGANFTGQKSQIEENPSWILSENKFADKAWAGDLDRYSKYTDSQGRKRVVAMAATSPSMNNAKIPLGIIRAKDANRPTMYLLNGAGGGEQSTNWMTFDSAIRFYLDRNVNVVVPMRGAFTYYIDWYDKKGAKGDAYIDGPQNWETFLTKELAEPIEQTLGSNGQRGIVGLSMSATSSLLLAARNPGFYKAVGSYSGCASTSRPIPYMFASITLQREGISPRQVFGPMGSSYNTEHDALVKAEGLRGSAIYVSNATGLMSQNETFNRLRKEGAESAAAANTSSDIVVTGGLIEGATNACTHDLRAKLNGLNIPADYKFRNTGVHTWYYWLDDMRESWPTFARGFGLENELASVPDKSNYPDPQK